MSYTPPPPPEGPESVQSPKIGPIEQKPAGRNWLPIALGGAVTLIACFSLGLIVFALFFFQGEMFQPEITGQQAEIAPTLDVAAFSFDGDAKPADNDSDLEPESPTQDTSEPDVQIDEQVNPPEIVEPDSPTAEDITSAPEAPPISADNLSIGLDKMSSPDFGIQAFLFWRSENADRDLKLVEDIKFNWVKQEFPWREIEGEVKGGFDWANADRMMDQIDDHGLNVIARVSTQPKWAGGGFPEVGPPDDYQDFVDYLTALATRYKGRIDAYQIWNEPNLAREWGERPPSPTEYAELLRLSYTAIKAIDPEAVVISAGLAPTTRYDDVAMPDVIFVQGMYDAGAQPYFDALGVHGPGFKVDPATDPDVVANDPALNNNDPSPTEFKRVYAFRHIEDLRKIMVDNGDENKRVVVLEFGWTVDDRKDSPYYWHAVDKDEQALYIIRAYNYAQANWQPWIGVMSLIFLPHPEWTEDDEQYYWSITFPDYPEFRARPAYWGLLEYGRNRTGE